MLRAFSAAISGMRTQMTFMDTVANNISNANTTAFKTTRARFSDMLYQTLQRGSGPTENLGTSGPSQVGLGVRLAAIDTNMVQGALRATNNPLDLAIEGEGFFTVSPDGGTTKLYTRDGAFNLDANGDLVNSANGLKVLDASGAVINIEPGAYASVSIGSDGTIRGVPPDGSAPVELQQIGVTTFPNPAGLEKQGDNMWKVSGASGVASEGGGEDTERASGSIRSGVLEGSNVDLATEFSNMIMSQRGFQANSRVISNLDEILQDLVNLKR
jgi:flagellar hook protein FlgE